MNHVIHSGILKCDLSGSSGKYTEYFVCLIDEMLCIYDKKTVDPRNSLSLRQVKAVCDLEGCYIGKFDKDPTYKYGFAVINPYRRTFIFYSDNPIDEWLDFISQCDEINNVQILNADKEDQKEINEANTLVEMQLNEQHEQLNKDLIKLKDELKEYENYELEIDFENNGLNHEITELSNNLNNLIIKEDKLNKKIDKLNTNKEEIKETCNNITKTIHDFYNKICKTILTRLRSLELSDSTHLVENINQNDIDEEIDTRDDSIAYGKANKNSDIELLNISTNTLNSLKEYLDVILFKNHRENISNDDLKKLLVIVEELFELNIDLRIKLNSFQGDMILKTHQKLSKFNNENNKT